MSTHYPSRQEVTLKIQPELDWIRCRTIYAHYIEPSTPGIGYRDIVGEKGTAKPFAQNCTVNGRSVQTPKILADHVRFMAEIQNHPSDGLRRHYDRLNWGISKGNRVLSELKHLGHVVVNEVKLFNPKGGRAPLVPQLTPQGRQFLKEWRETLNKPPE